MFKKKSVLGLFKYPETLPEDFKGLSGTEAFPNSQMRITRVAIYCFTKVKII